MARFSDFSKYYSEVFPEVITPVTSKVETLTGEKDFHETKTEIVDNTFTDEVESDDDNGSGTDSINANE